MSLKLLSSDYGQIPITLLQQPTGKDEIKKITKSLCEAHRQGTVSNDVFEKIIEMLMLSFFEKGIDSKFANKSEHLEKKLYKLFK